MSVLLRDVPAHIIVGTDEIAQRTAALVATGMTQQAAAAQELAERDQIATLANDSGNVTQLRYFS